MSKPYMDLQFTHSAIRPGERLTKSQAFFNLYTKLVQATGERDLEGNKLTKARRTKLAADLSLEFAALLQKFEVVHPDSLEGRAITKLMQIKQKLKKR